MAVSVEQFGKALTASGLFTAEELKALWSGLPADARPKQGEGFAKLLIDQGKLTPFQADEILSGRNTPLVMGEYILTAKIGEGGMGQVYKAQHQRMNRTVALKVLSVAAMKDATAIKRFQREVRAAAKLEHPNIVTAYDSGDAGKVSYLVMQFVDGGDLASLVRHRGPLEMERAVEFVCQTAQGLAYAHAEGVVHRDIKPANLLVDKRGVVKILDMGLARIDDASGGDGLTGTEQVMGTVDYMSPEQAADTKHVDARTDIYSLGCTLWYLLTGKRLFDGDTAIQRLMKHRNEPRPSLVKMRDDVSWPLEQAFHKMVAVETQNRYASMDEVLAALEPYRPSRVGGSQTGMSSGIGTGSGPVNAELSAFLKTVGPAGSMTGAAAKGQTTTAAGATQGDAPTAMHTAAQAETDPQSEMLAPSPKSAGRDARRGGKSADGLPLKPIIAGVGVCAVLVVGAVLFFMSRGGDASDSAAGENAGNKATAQAAALGGSPKANPLAAPSGSARSSAASVPPLAFFGGSAPDAPPPGNYALRFGGINAKPFAVPGWNYQGDTPLTIEAWITPEIISYQSYLGNGKQAGLRLGLQTTGWEFVWVQGGGKFALVSSDGPPTQGRRTHVAVVSDRSSLLLYIDGVEQEKTGFPYRQYFTDVQPFMIGSSIDNSGANKDRWHGACTAVIDEVRISRVVRYQKKFTPAERLQPDADTEVLYHFDEGAGETVHDASPFARHAKLQQAGWVESDGSPIVLPSSITATPSDRLEPTGDGTGATSEQQIALAERIVALGGRATFGATGFPADIPFKNRADLNGIPKPYLTDIACGRDSSLKPTEIDVLTRSLALRAVTIDSCKWVTDEVVRKLCKIKTIRLLRIGSTAATRAVVPDIAALSELETLYCSNIGFADDDLLRLATMPQLSYLQIDLSPITAAGIAHFAKFPELKWLYMRHVPIDEAGLEQLANLTGVKEINVTGSGVTAAQEAKLKAALPQCTISWNPGSGPKP